MRCANAFNKTDVRRKYDRHSQTAIVRMTIRRQYGMTIQGVSLKSERVRSELSEWTRKERLNSDERKPEVYL